MKAINILLIIIIGISLLMAGCVDDKLTSEQIEQQILANQDSVRDISYTIAITRNNETMVMDYAYKQPNMIRMEYKEPAEIAGQIMVSNGTHGQMYDPIRNSVRVEAIPEYAQTNASMNAQLIEEVLNTSAIVPNGTGSVLGHVCYRITATPKETGMTIPISMEMWFDKWSWMPVKIDTYQNNELAMCMEYRDIKLNTNIPNSTFEFEIPEGATVESTDEAAAPEPMTIEDAQAEVSFDIKEPVNLPPGYEIENVMVTPVSASADGVVIVYANATDENMRSAQLTMVQLVESTYNESAEPMPMPEGANETITIGDGYDCTMTTMETPFGNTVILWCSSGTMVRLITCLQVRLTGKR